jgi:hypothetical protein
MGLVAGASAAGIPSMACQSQPEAFALKSGPLALPAVVSVVIESHLASREDTFPGKRLFPSAKEERMGLHLVRSCQLLLKFLPETQCSLVYSDPSAQVWTPAEGNGTFGQGSVGDLRPPAVEEMWSGNMNWVGADKPTAGSRYLVTAGDRSVVLIMGYETGPSDARHILGVQPEVAFYLKVKNDARVKVERLVDQKASPGPVICNTLTG